MTEIRRIDHEAVRRLHGRDKGADFAVSLVESVNSFNSRRTLAGAVSAARYTPREGGVGFHGMIRERVTGIGSPQSDDGAPHTHDVHRASTVG